MNVAQIILPLHGHRAVTRESVLAQPGLCVGCLAIGLHQKKDTTMKTPWIAGTIIAANEATTAVMIKTRPLNGPADGGDGDESDYVDDNDGSADDDSDETSNLVAEAARHLDSIQDYNAPDDKDGHVKKARDLLSKHLQAIGAEPGDDAADGDQPVRTQLSNSLHTIQFAPIGRGF
jgi:hypothetical protein